MVLHKKCDKKNNRVLLFITALSLPQQFMLYCSSLLLLMSKDNIAVVAAYFAGGILLGSPCHLSRWHSLSLKGNRCSNVKTIAVRNRGALFTKSVMDEYRGNEEDNKDEIRNDKEELETKQAEIITGEEEVPLSKISQKVSAMPLHQLLDTLDRKRIPYHVKSSRTELELALIQGYYFRKTPRRQRRNIIIPSNNNEDVVKTVTNTFNHWWDNVLDSSDYNIRGKRRSTAGVLYDHPRRRSKRRSHYSNITTSERNLKRTSNSTHNEDYDNRTIRSTDVIIRRNPSERRRRRVVLPTSTSSSRRILLNNNRYHYWRGKLMKSVDLLLGLDETAPKFSNNNNWESRSFNGKDQDEESSSMVSTLLFGRTPGKKKNFLSFFPRGLATKYNICTSTLATALQLSLLGAANICRWATVQGTIPQPFVVLSVLSTFLAARRKRFFVSTVTLLLIRTMGEVLSSNLDSSDSSFDLQSVRNSKKRRITPFVEEDGDNDVNIKRSRRPSEKEEFIKQQRRRRRPRRRVVDDLGGQED